MDIEWNEYIMRIIRTFNNHARKSNTSDKASHAYHLFMANAIDEAVKKSNDSRLKEWFNRDAI